MEFTHRLSVTYTVRDQLWPGDQMWPTSKSLSYKVEIYMVYTTITVNTGKNKFSQLAAGKTCNFTFAYIRFAKNENPCMHWKRFFHHDLKKISYDYIFAKKYRINAFKWICYHKNLSRSQKVMRFWKILSLIANFICNSCF